MLAKFETKSARVKGLSFHPKRPWILASLHSGAIHLWDYKMGTMVDKFEEHEGPVRGVHFHPSQPLFVSGGDDYKIKVWNYKQSRCLFTLNGHLDYIRTVYFHSELPWIISASDDQTIRIWNWQSRTCISIITGHNHYVMSANFHPSGQELIVSASLDQTVRVWDMSGLVKKHSAGSGGPSSMADDPYSTRPGTTSQGDYFVNTDVVVKHILEGHDRGVNWASFHPTLPLIVSAGDDRVVKLWRTNDTKAWEVDSCRGHYNNVSCVIFHPKQDFILSNSEDKTIRIWDLNKRTAVATYRRENDRFWCIVAHPELNLFAAAHDHGLIVFKLERERPAHFVTEDSVLYMNDKIIRRYDFATGATHVAGSLKRTTTTLPRTISYNATEGIIILSGFDKDPYYEISYTGKAGGLGGQPQTVSDKGTLAIFVARNRFAVLDKTNNTVQIKDQQNNVTKYFDVPSTTTSISNAAGKNILLVSNTSVTLFDTELKTAVKELSIARVRYVIWSPDMSHVALMAKHTITIATNMMEKVCSIHETIKLKSGVWNEHGVFFYTTLNHIKFALLNGDNGIIKTLESPMYVVKIRGNAAYCLNRKGDVIGIAIDPTEVNFKLNLLNRQFDKVLHMIQHSNLVGQSIIGYLQKQGYPEVALQFVKDSPTRFELAIAYGNMEVAVETARAIDQDVYWDRLAAEALQQGNHSIVEMAYQRTKKFEKLSFLYLLTGNVDKLGKMLKVAQIRNDTASVLQNAMYLGDLDSQISVFLNAGQPQLAYLYAKTHGLTDLAASILANAQRSESQIRGLVPGVLLKPPTPLLKEQGPWPLTPPSTRLFDSVLPPAGSSGKPPKSLAMSTDDFAASVAPVKKPVAVAPVHATGGGWGGDDDLVFGNPNLDPNGENAVGEGWGDEDINLDELDLPSEEYQPSSNDDVPLSPNSQGRFILPLAGRKVEHQWSMASKHAFDHAAAGSFGTALQLLNKQMGVVNFEPLKPYLLAAAQSSHAWLNVQEGAPPVPLTLLRQPGTLPHAAFTLANLNQKMDEAFALTTAGKFTEAIVMFRDAIWFSLFLVDGSDTGDKEAAFAHRGMAAQYILGLGMEVRRKELSPDTALQRIAELSAYFAICPLDPVHQMLALRSAMLFSFKVKNFSHAAYFAQQLVALKPQAQVEQQAQKIIMHYERNRTSNQVVINFDPDVIMTICAGSQTPVTKGQPSLACPCCGACFKQDFKGSVCVVCEVGDVGRF